LGIGAGWFELEHNSLGYEFGTFTDRFEKLEEALQIIIPMLRGETVTFSGKHYSVTDAINSPAPVSRIPVMIGGSGEKKTLRMVAQYADESNLSRGTAEEVKHKLQVLDEHCARLGRNRAEIKVTKMTMVCVAPTMEQAMADARALSGVKGWTDEVIEMIKGMIIFGDPDTVGEKIQEFVDAGVDGLTINLPINGHITERISLVGEIANKILK
jgi:alkanesulfonate monooxygenase SsuD/methylene tetrahydromethanopterin reductase-like flavin-dependent oxidoreductase (luciferase family)